MYPEARRRLRSALPALVGAAVVTGVLLPAAGATAGAPPTVASCLDAWNASPPALRLTRPTATPAVVEALNGGVWVAGPQGSTQPEIRGFACTIWIAAPPRHATFIVGSYGPQGTAHWRKPVEATGLLAGAIPNADLGTDGRLTLRTTAPSKPVGPTQAHPPRVSHQISAAGWAGGLRLYQTLARAIRRFGKPTEVVPSGLGCRVAWPALQLTGTFMFGTGRQGTHAQPTPCGDTGRVLSLSVTSTWSTSRGLAVGAAEAEIARRYPGATSTTSLAAGSTTWYLVPRHASASAQGLTAETRAGIVTSLTVSAGSMTFGADIVPAKSP
jgi:hypothetical protein